MNMTTVPSDKLKEIQAENAALKEQVAQLGIEFTVYKRATDLAYKGSELETQEQLTALKSKFDVLVDALETTVPYLWNSSAIGADVVAEQTLAVIKGVK